MSLFCMSMTKSLSDEYDELVDAAPSLSLPDSSANTHQHVTDDIIMRMYMDIRLLYSKYVGKQYNSKTDVSYMFNKL